MKKKVGITKTFHSVCWNGMLENALGKLAKDN